MSVYGELDHMIDYRTQFAFKGKREHISYVNMPNSIPKSTHWHWNTAWFKRSKLHCNLDITSTEKAGSVVNNVGRALVKTKVLMLGLKDIDTINNSAIYDTYKDFYLSEKECEEKLLQGIRWANDLKARVGAKNQMAQHWHWQRRKMPLKRRLINGLQYH